MTKFRWFILSLVGLLSLGLLSQFFMENKKPSRPSQIEIFSIKALASGEIPTIPENVHTIYIPNFQFTTLEELRAAIANVQTHYPHIKIVPYLPVRKYSKTEVHEILKIYRDAQIDELLVLAGGAFPHPEEHGAYSSSAEFLKNTHLKDWGFNTIGIAAHPEYHFQMDAEERMNALKEKYTLAKQQGLNFYLVTQVVCNPSRFALWQEEVRAQGIDSPIYYGVLLSKLELPLYQKFILQMCQAVTTDPNHPDFDNETVRILNSPEEQDFHQIESKLKALGVQTDGFHFYLYGGNLQDTLNRLNDL